MGPRLRNAYRVEVALDSTVGKLVRRPVDGSKGAGRGAAKASADREERLSFALKEASRLPRGPGRAGTRACACSFR
jgi:hypothetical protein